MKGLWFFCQHTASASWKCKSKTVKWCFCLFQFHTLTKSIDYILFFDSFTFLGLSAMFFGWKSKWLGLEMIFTSTWHKGQDICTWIKLNTYLNIILWIWNGIVQTLFPLFFKQVDLLELWISFVMFMHFCKNFNP